MTSSIVAINHHENVYEGREFSKRASRINVWTTDPGFRCAQFYMEFCLVLWADECERRLLEGNPST